MYLRNSTTEISSIVKISENRITFFILSGISIFLTFIVVLSMRKKNNTYAKLMHRICFSESSLIFTLIIFYFDTNTVLEYFVKLFNKVTFYKLNLSIKHLVSWNFILSLLSRTFSQCMNGFLSFEMIKILKNPISQQKSRVFYYDLITILICLIEIILIGIVQDINDEYDDSYSVLTNYSNYFEKFNYYFNFTLIPYLCFLLVGFYSIILLISRFYCGNFIIKNLKHWFVIRHALYVILYLVIFFPYYFYIILIQANVQGIYNDRYLTLYKYSVFAMTSIGTIMFPFRVSETQIVELFSELLNCKKNKAKLMRKRNSEDISDSSVIISKNENNKENNKEDNKEINSDIEGNTSGNESDKTINYNENKSNCSGIKSAINAEKDQNQQGSSFFDNDQPLSAIISCCMNLEFMCCILYGLHYIFDKQAPIDEFREVKDDSIINQRKPIDEEIEESNSHTAVDENINLNIQDEIGNPSKTKRNSLGKSLPFMSSKTRSGSSSKKGRKESELEITSKDFHYEKSHQIKYKKFFDNEIDVNKFSIEVYRNPKKDKKNIKRKNNNEKINRRIIDYKLSLTSDLGESTSTIFDETSIKNFGSEANALIIEYCPKIFKKLRHIDEVEKVIKNSLDPANNLENINKIKESQGKSGSFFFFSADNQFIIKTINEKELNTLLNDLLEKYYNYINENPSSLLGRIYGVYTVKISVSEMHVILMQNLNKLGNDYIYLKRYFDLKGSFVGRKTKNFRSIGKDKPLKDIDFLNMKQINKDLFNFNNDSIEEIMDNLEMDLELLTDANIMDYSILLYIFDFPDIEDEHNFNKFMQLFANPRYKNRIFKSASKKYIYLVGIIDFLQAYNSKKKIENKIKAILYLQSRGGVSAVPPDVYAHRMLNFARTKIFVKG